MLTINIKRLPECSDNEWNAAINLMRRGYEVAKSKFNTNDGTPQLIIRNDTISAQIINDQNVLSASTKEWAESEYTAQLRQYGITHVSVWTQYTPLNRGGIYGR